MVLFDTFILLHQQVLSLLFVALVLALYHLNYFNQMREVQSLLLLLFIASLGIGAYYSIRLQSQSEIFSSYYPSAREVELSLRITQVLAPNQSYDTLQALVEILESDSSQRINSKERIFLSVPRTKSLEYNWQLGSEIHLRAVHRFFSEDDLSKSFY